MGTEWVNTGAAENVPLILRAATECETGLDISGISNIYRRSKVDGSRQNYAPAESDHTIHTWNNRQGLGEATALAGNIAGLDGISEAVDMINRPSLRNRPVASLEMVIYGPQGQNAGPGYLSGFLWAVVNLTLNSVESSSKAATIIRYSVGDKLLNCTAGQEYTGPIFLAATSNVSEDAPELTYIHALACIGGTVLAQQEGNLDLVHGPYLTISTNITIANIHSDLFEITSNSLSTAACTVLSISLICDERVSILWDGFASSGMGVVTVKILAESNFEAAAWRKILLSQRNLNVSDSSGVVFPVRIDSVNVTVPVPNWRLIPVTDPCTSHYDCASEPTGQRVVNGENVTQYGWGRSFCAIWGSTVTNGVGPTCDSCRLYCTSASLSSIDGICPENCGTPWSGTLPPCLSAQILRENYNCESRRRFELWQHSSPGNPPPNPQTSSVSYMRTVSPFNNILGAVVVTQTRASTAACVNEGNERLTSFTSSHSVSCIGPELSGRNGSGGYGVDPTFEVFSSLFDGKDMANQYYNGQEVAQSGPQANYNATLEGFFSSDGAFVPFGFFPHSWDQVFVCNSMSLGTI